MATNNILKELDLVLQERKTAPPDTSYVATLYAKGLSKILEKVGEEATEVIIAAKDLESSNPDDQSAREEELVKEVADLWFHTLVGLNHLNLSSDDVLAELGKRFGIGGLEEKASRNS